MRLQKYAKLVILNNNQKCTNTQTNIDKREGRWYRPFNYNLLQKRTKKNKTKNIAPRFVVVFVTYLQSYKLIVNR